MEEDRDKLYIVVSCQCAEYMVFKRGSFGVYERALDIGHNVPTNLTKAMALCNKANRGEV